MAKIGGKSGMPRAVATAPAPGPADAPAPGRLRIISDPVRGSAWITGQLRQAIQEGHYTHGEKLPAERQLAEAFGTSRTTVRMALDHLENERLVTRRVGSGTFVNYRPPNEAEEVAEMTSPVELIEVRIGLEPHMVRLAVLNATARDVDKLSEIVQQLEKGPMDAERFTQLDEAFHLTIAECTHNPLLVSLYRQINDVRTHAQWNAMKDKVLTPKRIADYNIEHRSIFESIRSRDVDTAVTTITNHLHYARRQLLGVGNE